MSLTFFRCYIPNETTKTTCFFQEISVTFELNYEIYA